MLETNSGNPAGTSAGKSAAPQFDLNASPRFEVRGGDLVCAQSLGVEYVGTVDDPIKAHACLEFGCEVIDRRTGKPAFSSGDKK